MRRSVSLCLLATVLAYVSGCGEAPTRPSVVTDRPVNPPKTRARYILVPWDISLFFNIPGGAVVAGVSAATPGAAAEGDNLTGTFVNSNGFGGTLTGVLTGNLDSGNFNGILTTVTPGGCIAERRFSGPLTTNTLNWSPGDHLNDCGGTSPLTGGIQASSAPATTQPCSYSASVNSTSFPAGGGSGTVNVTAGSDCTWFANSTASFVTVSASQGAADGSINFTVAPNTTITQRTATLVVAGQSFTLTQAAAACAFSLSESGRTVDAEGGNSAIEMRTLAGCAWQASSDVPWLIVRNTSGTGTGPINFAVESNPGLSQRIGTITAAGQRFTVTQNAITCTYTVTPPATTAFPSAGGTGAVGVATPAACTWTAASNVPWITITPPPGATGPGSVAFTVAATTEIAARTGTMTIAGHTVTITQAPATVGTISGTVTNSVNGGPVSGATVAIGNLTATTGTGGTYTLPNVPVGPQTVRVSAPEFVSRSDTVVVGVQTTHNVVLTAGTPALTFSYNTNPVFPPEDRHCGGSENVWCWRFTSTLHNIGTASLTVGVFEISLYNSANQLEQHTVYTPAEFARLYGGATGVSAGGTAVGELTVFFRSPSGGTIELFVSAADSFNRRPYNFRASPRLPAQERVVGLRAVPGGGQSTTAPPPRPRGGGQ